MRAVVLAATKPVRGSSRGMTVAPGGGAHACSRGPAIATPHVSPRPGASATSVRARAGASATAPTSHEHVHRGQRQFILPRRSPARPATGEQVPPQGDIVSPAPGWSRGPRCSLRRDPNRPSVEKPDSEKSGVRSSCDGCDELFRAGVELRERIRIWSGKGDCPARRRPGRHGRSTPLRDRWRRALAADTVRMDAPRGSEDGAITEAASVAYRSVARRD